MKLQRKRPYAYRGKRRITWWKALAALALAGILVFAGLFGAVMYGSYDHIQDDPRLGEGRGDVSDLPRPLCQWGCLQ